MFKIAKFPHDGFAGADGRPCRTLAPGDRPIPVRYAPKALGFRLARPAAAPLFRRLESTDEGRAVKAGFPEDRVSTDVSRLVDSSVDGKLAGVHANFA